MTETMEQQQGIPPRGIDDPPQVSLTRSQVGSALASLSRINPTARQRRASRVNGKLGGRPKMKKEAKPA